MKLLTEQQQSAIDCINHLQDIQKDSIYPINFSKDIIRLYISIKYRHFVKKSGEYSLLLNNSNDSNVAKMIIFNYVRNIEIERTLQYHIEKMTNQVLKITLTYKFRGIFLLIIDTTYLQNEETVYFYKVFEFSQKDFKELISILYRD